eukprot:scaffold1798_cov118-Isochrysis_galbana.AAC.8
MEACADCEGMPRGRAGKASGGARVVVECGGVWGPQDGQPNSPVGVGVGGGAVRTSVTHARHPTTGVRLKVLPSCARSCGSSGASCMRRHVIARPYTSYKLSSTSGVPRTAVSCSNGQHNCNTPRTGCWVPDSVGKLSQ